MQAVTALNLRARDLRFHDDWRPGPAVPLIHTSDVHVWRISLDVPVPQPIALMVSEDERHRAARFRLERDQRRFIIARAALRMILARYLFVDPAELKFQTNAFGKPFLLDHGSSLRFNLSHSNELALLAIAAGREVGIDIEFMRADVATDEVAQNFFSQLEVRQLRSIDPRFRRIAFFNCWTRKEAYIKARGRGLFLPLDQFDVSIGLDEPPSLLANRLEPAEPSRWSFRQLFPATGYAATLAAEGTLRAVEQWECGAIC